MNGRGDTPAFDEPGERLRQAAKREMASPGVALCRGPLPPRSIASNKACGVQHT